MVTIEDNDPQVNHPPVANANTLSTDELMPANGTLSADDEDNDRLIFSVVTNGLKGTAVITNATTGSYTYTPKYTATGRDSFTFKVNDGKLDSAPATVSVTINAVQDGDDSDTGNTDQDSGAGNTSGNGDNSDVGSDEGSGAADSGDGSSVVDGDEGSGAADLGDGSSVFDEASGDITSINIDEGGGGGGGVFNLLFLLFTSLLVCLYRISPKTHAE